MGWTGSVTSLVIFLAAATALFTFVEDHQALDQDRPEITIIVLDSNGTAATWKSNQVYDTFRDGGRFYVVKYDRNLVQISESDYQKLRGDAT